ncbi:MAG: D-alanyl-D-alanine carboxypeptidase [Gammaproteobacteria bacterium]|nr:D-alanyl-D-alanine carboxypeptidase [Gammaproteobacteria bacterium]
MQYAREARRLLVTLVIVGATAVTADAQVQPPPTLEAKAWILVDHETGKVLAAQNENARLGPASITKLMTAYAVYKALAAGAVKMNDPVQVSENAWRTGGAGSGGSTTMLPINSSATLEVMLKGMIIQSGNDASIALAEHLAGSEAAFSDVMNRHAQELGLENSHFMNATGLPDPNHFMSAADIAALSRAIIREFPEHYAWYRERDYVFNGIKQGNRNLLLYRDPTVDGLKTGHTSTAGYCLAASAKRGDMRLVSVVMAMANEEARAKASGELLNYGFRFYETRRLYQAGQKLANARVWKGSAEQVGLGLAEDVWVTIPRGSAAQVQAKTDTPRDLVAPVATGTPAGRLTLTLAGQPLAETGLVPLAAIAKGSLWRQAVDTVLLWFE